MSHSIRLRTIIILYYTIRQGDLSVIKSVFKRFLHIILLSCLLVDMMTVVKTLKDLCSVLKNCIIILHGQYCSTADSLYIDLLSTQNTYIISSYT